MRNAATNVASFASSKAPRARSATLDAAEARLEAAPPIVVRAASDSFDASSPELQDTSTTAAALAASTAVNFFMAESLPRSVGFAPVNRPPEPPFP